MEWVYKAQDLRTGAVRADRIRGLTVGTMSRKRGDEAEGDMTLSLSGNSAFTDVLEPRRTVVFALGDGQPYWAGILWDAPHASARSNTLPLHFKTLESLFARRQVRDNLTYGNNDQLDIFRSVFRYATSKTGGGIANLVIDETLSGVLRQRNYLGSDKTAVLDILQNLGNVDNGFEWTIDPIWFDYVGGRLGFRVRLGYPTLGVNAIADQVLRFPGNLQDYAWPRLGASSANDLVAVGDTPTGGASQMTSDSAHGLNSAEIDAGYPLVQDSISYGGDGITDVATLNDHATQDMLASAGNTVNPLFYISLEQQPSLNQIALGNGFSYDLTSSYHPNGKTGTTRVSQIDIKPSNPGQAVIYGDQVIDGV